MIKMRKYCQCGSVIHVRIKEIGEKAILGESSCSFFEDRDGAISQCYKCMRLLGNQEDVFSAVELLPSMRVFDLGDVVGERFTICFNYRVPTPALPIKTALSLSMNCDSLLGISQWGEVVIGEHLGKEIKFSALPQHIQDHVVQRYLEG